MNQNIISGPPMGFYPAHKESLISLMEEFSKEFENISIEKPSGTIRGMVVPHAGLVYSGFTAYCAYKLLSEEDLTGELAVVIFAPSHHVFFQGMVTAYNTIFQTPLGNLPVADRLLKPLLSKKWLENSPKAHQEEHSLQVQIPFLQYFFKKKPLHFLPFLLSGNLPSEHWVRIFDDFLSTINSYEKVIFIASSDLYHGLSYEEACQKDEQTIDGIINDRAEDFWKKCVSNTYMACGSLPVFAVKYMAEQKGFSRTHLVHRTNSNDVMGEKGGYVVGYTSILFCE